MIRRPPTIGIGAPSVSSIAAGAGSVTYTVTYADTNFNASTLTSGNITLNSTGSDSGTVGVSGSGLPRTVTISSITGAGTLGISIAADTASDTAGNTAPADGPSATFTVISPPGAPTSPVATRGNASASVAFTAPASNGGSTITGYTVTSNPGGVTGTGSASPISVGGLTNGTAYTFTVTATNVIGTGAASAASNSVTPAGVADITASLGGGILTINASVAAGTTFRVVGAFLEIYDPTLVLGGGAGITSVDSHTIRVPLASIPNGLVVDGSAAADSFTFDFTDPALALAGGITVNGGLPNTAPGDVLIVDNGSFSQVDYTPIGPGAGTVDLDLTPVITFAGLEPLDFSGSAIGNLVVDIDAGNTFVGNITTTVAAVDAGVNTEISFGSSGLESIKVGAVTGRLTVNGDNVEQDYIVLSGLGTAMVGDFTVDGKGGDSDVVEINNTTFTVAGAGKNFSAKADFIGLGRDVTGINPGVLVCSGNITLEADGDGSLSPVLFGAGGVWSLPTYFDSAPFQAARRGTVQVCGAITKSSGADATLTMKARNSVFLTRAGTSTSGGTITSTSNKLNVIMNADSDSTNGGVAHCNAYSSVTSNGGDITLGGGATPATSPAIGNGPSAGSSGIFLSSTTLTSGGGNISVRGLGAAAGTSTIGTFISVTTGAQDCVINSGAGSVSIVGTGGTAGIATGIQISGLAAGPLFTKVLSTTGSISISGTPVGTSVGVSFGAVASTTIRAQSAGGNVTFTGDRMNLNLSTGTKIISTTGSGIVTLQPLTAGRLINLGSTVDNTASTLELSNAELANVTAPTLTIGDGSNGNITVSAVLSPINYPTLALIGNTDFSATGGFTSDVTSASVYEKVTVAGTVNITANAALTMNSAGGYVWNGTDTFTMLSNDAGDAITGPFTGPTLSSFLGSALTAQQSYTGGSGNDLVIGNLNSAPTDIALSAASIAENNTAGATIGTLTATDANIGDTHTFTFAGGADDGAFTITGNTLTINGSADFETQSSYTIRIRATDNGAGNLTFEKQFTISITGVTIPQTINFGALAGKTFGDAAFNVSATGGASGQPVTFSIFSGPATIAGNTVTITGAGSVTVRASQAGAGDYSAASDVDQSFTVAQAAQSITFNPAATALQTDTVTLSATGGASGNAVTFSLISGPGSLAGNVLTFTATGPVVIRASQAGNANYLAAADVDRTITVGTPSGQPAVDDAITSTTGSSVLYPLANDGNPNATITAVSDPLVTIDGRALIVPEGYSAPSFTYTTSDGHTATVTVTVGSPLLGARRFAGLLYDNDGSIVGIMQVNRTLGGTFTASIKSGAVTTRPTFMLTNGTGTVPSSLGTLTVTDESNGRFHRQQ